MSGILEFYDRALNGERMEGKTFDIEVLPDKLQGLIQKYEISYNREDVVLQDLDMAKRVFEAALDLVLEVGVYFIDTKSIIKIERDEIIRALKDAPASHTMGTGADEVECYARGIEDKRRPLIIGGVNGAPIS